MTTVEVPLRHVLLYRGTVVGSGWALPRDQADRLWRNLGWSLTVSDEPSPDIDRCCATCGATWVGPRSESCWWCERAAAALLEGQRTLVLMEPEVDVLDGTDAEIETAAQAWAARLAVAVKADLVVSWEADEAVKAWLRKVTRWRPLSA